MTKTISSFLYCQTAMSVHVSCLDRKADMNNRRSQGVQWVQGHPQDKK